MTLVCITCKKTNEKSAMGKKIRCIYCGGKILMKQRPKISKKINTD